jgi:hypothetical protein
MSSHCYVRFFPAAMCSSSGSRCSPALLAVRSINVIATPGRDVTEFVGCRGNHAGGVEGVRSGFELEPLVAQEHASKLSSLVTAESPIYPVPMPPIGPTTTCTADAKRQLLLEHPSRASSAAHHQPGWGHGPSCVPGRITVSGQATAQVSGPRGRTLPLAAFQLGSLGNMS